VIKRINAVPEYTAEQKALLIKKMEQARSMERLAVVRFGLGETNLQRAAADELVKIFNTPAMQTKLSDKTVILIVAGYADTGGRAETNLTLSRERADAVTSVLRWRLKVTNSVQTIGMGETELLSNERPDQNRAVEVWAVSPI
jgi:outer membrane protein OmpA-like peptidoglycan-associated protein